MQRETHGKHRVESNKFRGYNEKVSYMLKWTRGRENERMKQMEYLRKQRRRQFCHLGVTVVKLQKIRDKKLKNIMKRRPITFNEFQ